MILTAPALGGPVKIGPLRLDLGPRARVAAVTLSNQGAETMNFQAQVETWTQNDGGDQRAGTDDIVVSPPISEIPAGKAQTFRVAMRRPLQPGPERAYRLVLTDVTPSALQATGKPAVAIRIAHSIPLFVQTVPGGKPDLAVGPCAPPDKAGILCAQVRNDGSIHAMIRRVTFHSAAWTESPTYNVPVLAGGAQSFTIVPPVTIGRQARVAVTVESDGAGASGFIGAATP